MNKLILVIPSFKTGGGIRVFIELANVLVRDYNITIVFPNNSHDINTFNINSNIKLCSIGHSASNHISKLWNMCKVFFYLNTRSRKDFVFYTDPIFSVFYFLLFHRKSYRFIQADDYTIFDDGKILGTGIFLKIYKFLCIHSYKKCRHIFIFNSRFVYDSVIKASNRSNLPFLRVHPAIEHTIFKTNANIEREPLSICLVARSSPLKDLQLFLTAYKGLPDNIRKKLGKVRLISHDNLSKFDISDFELICPKSDSDIVSVFCKSDIYILTSWVEGFGLPPLEAMACGCSCILSDAGGISEYAVSNENCLIYPPRNVCALQNALIQLCNNPFLRTKLSNAGIATAKKFSWKKSALQLVDILKY